MYAINSQRPGQFGSGLPIYTKKEYQYRYRYQDQILSDGYIKIAGDRVPPYQFASLLDIDQERLIEVVGLDDGPSVGIPIGSMNSIQQKSQPLAMTGERIYYNLDETLGVNICGLYYLEFTDTTQGISLYSEVFKALKFQGKDLTPPI